MSIFHTRNFAILILFSFLTIGIFCFWNTPAMAMGDSMNPCSGCGNEMILCGISAQDHIPAWQNLLYVIPQKSLDLFLLALLLIFVSDTYKKIWPRTLEIVKSLIARNYEIISIIDPIKRALARGIIQPQIYNSIVG